MGPALSRAGPNKWRHFFFCSFARSRAAAFKRMTGYSLYISALQLLRVFSGPWAGQGSPGKRPMKKSREHGRDYVQSLPALIFFLPGCFTPLSSQMQRTVQKVSNEHAMKRAFPRLVIFFCFSVGCRWPDLKLLQNCNNHEQKPCTQAATLCLSASPESDRQMDLRRASPSESNYQG